ncbi:MAG: AAA family ATPase [Chloroflexi bacterium]|nr:AAA family ATPase [Chloroflexota bacterium]
MIIGFVNQKGGVGKTTLSLNVAHYLALKGARVLLIDADRQRSAATWAESRGDAPPPFTVIEMARENMARDAMQMAGDYDHVVIDGPRDAEAITRNVIVTSEIVVVPIEPSAFSTNAAKTTIAQIEECQIIKPTLKCGIVVSRKITGTVIGSDIRDIAAESGFPILEQDIATRVAFAEAATLAQTIFEYQPNSDAAKEIHAFAQEIERMHNGQKKLQNRAASKTAHA